MRHNPVKQKLFEGGTSLGTFVFEFNTTGIGRIAGHAGAEFVVYDMEHTGWSVETIRMLIATTPVESAIPMVRVPTTQYHFIARVLDVGAMGIMVPMVETREQAELLVSSAKYPPVGRRGAAFGVAHDNYAGDNIIATMENANRQQILMTQIETVKGLENVDKIASTDGIDVLWIGHFDLTNSMGIPGQFEHPDFKDAVAKVSQVCQDQGKIAGMMSASVENSKWLMDQGYRMLAYGGDLWLYQHALADALKQVRSERM